MRGRARPSPDREHGGTPGPSFLPHPGLPQRAAQRISELNRFLYFRISGVSLWARVLVGFTLTTEPFLTSYCS